MSKSTKIIAALGVVAGLGVAALPAMTFADDYTYTAQSVNANADIYVEIPEAIAMTISGNNDDNAKYGTSGDNGIADRFSPATGDPATVDGHARNINALNSSSYASLTQNASVHGAKGEGANGFMSTITVYTNSAKGYTLGLSEWGALVNQTNSDATIAGDGIVKAGHSGWGYAVDTAVTADATDASTANYAHADNNAIKTRNSATSGGEVTGVYYGVSTSADQAAGLYKKSLTYTAITKNS